MFPRERVELGERDMKCKYDDQASIAQLSFIPEKYLLSVLKDSDNQSYIFKFRLQRIEPVACNF